MRIAVIGAGGVGGYFGGRLARAGEDVTFLARGATLRALRESGLRVDSADAAGDFVIAPARATDDAATVGEVDLVLVAVKGWQLPEAIATMRPLVGAATVVLPLLNGVEAPDQLVAAFGAQHVAAGICGVFGSVVAPGHVRNTLPTPFIIVGELDNARSDRMLRIVHAFEQEGVPASLAEDIHAALWQKLMFVGPFGGVGAVTRAPVGVMRAMPETRALLEQAMMEILQVAHARGVAVPDSAVALCLGMIDNSPAPGTASMQRDITAGQPSELEAQIGAVVRLAREGGVAVPVHEFLYASLLPLERRARGVVVFPA